jgi:hypothetical protein
MIPRRRHHPLHGTRCTTSATEQASCQRNGMRNSGEPQRIWANPRQLPPGTAGYAAKAITAIEHGSHFTINGWDTT